MTFTLCFAKHKTFDTHFSLKNVVVLSLYLKNYFLKSFKTLETHFIFLNHVLLYEVLSCPFWKTISSVTFSRSYTSSSSTSISTLSNCVAVLTWRCNKHEALIHFACFIRKFLAYIKLPFLNTIVCSFLCI